MLTVHHFFFLVVCRWVHGVGLARRGEADHAWWQGFLRDSQSLPAKKPAAPLQRAEDRTHSETQRRKKRK